MSVSLYEKPMIPPLISVTSPRETNEKTIFFPPSGKAAMDRSEALSEGYAKTDIIILNGPAPRTVDANNTCVLPRVKPNIRQPDPGHFYMDHYVSNKENQQDYYHQEKHVITTRKGLARRNTTREREHVLPFSETMSGSKAQVKKVKIAAASLHGQGQDGKPSRTVGEKKSVVTSGHDKNTHISLALSRGKDSRSPKSTPKEGISRHFVNGKGIGKPAAVKAKEKKSNPDSLPQVNHALLQLKDSGGLDERSRRVSPGSSLEQIAEESATKSARRALNHSVTKPKGLGIERKTRTPSKVTPNASPAARSRRNDETGGHSLENRVQELELPKVTMNEVLQSWNIGPARTRSSSLAAGKDPMEFLRSRERSNSDPKQRTTTIEELRRCRYLRTGDDQARHSKICSCNSCEHGEGLKSTPYLNS